MSGAVAGSGVVGASTVRRRIGAGGKTGNTRGWRALADCEGSETGCSATSGFGEERLGGLARAHDLLAIVVAELAPLLKAVDQELPRQVGSSP